MRFKEMYTSGKVGTFDIPFPSEIFASLSRELIVTYLDNDLMIVRDSFGCPDVLKKIAVAPLLTEPVVDSKQLEDDVIVVDNETGEETPGDVEV